MGAFVNLRIQGTIYFTSCRNGKVPHMADMFSRRLVGESRESTFETLYSLFDGKWHKQYDIVHLFHEYQRDDDGRHALIESVWTFDLDNDTLRIDGKDFCGQVSLERVRQGLLQTTDINIYVPKAPPTDARQAALPPPYPRLIRTNLDLSHLKRQQAFLCGVLQDFAFQWRHVLRGPYNDSTFRRLAYAVIRILALDFTVEEISTPRRASGGHLVRLQDLPGWKVCNADIIRVGGVSIVMSQHILHALNLARADFRDSAAGRMKQHVHPASNDFRTYLLFSRHDVSLCQINGDDEKHTRPECLLDNTTKFTSATLSLFLKATQRSVSKYLIQRLPIEIQDMILERVAIGPIERAKFGCILNIGSIFEWKCDGRNIEREQADRHRISGTPIESRIRLDKCFSGLAYK